MSNNPSSLFCFSRLLISKFRCTSAIATTTIAAVANNRCKVTSLTTGQQVPAGELTISGTSTDNATTDCIVYADWNNTKPFQTAVATGPAGVNDHSRWTFTYTNNYHLITNGTNNLTSKFSCVGDDSNVGTTANLTKSFQRL